MPRLVLVWSTLVASACGSKEAANKDMGPCITIVKDGREYWLCEKLSAAKASPTVEPIDEPSMRSKSEIERASEEADQARLKAEQFAQQAVKDAQEAQEKVQMLADSLADLDKKVSAAADNVVAAQDDAERANATAKLNRLQKDKYEMEQRIAVAKATAARAERFKGVKISPECKATPLAKGCM